MTSSATDLALAGPPSSRARAGAAVLLAPLALLLVSACSSGEPPAEAGAAAARPDEDAAAATSSAGPASPEVETEHGPGTPPAGRERLVHLVRSRQDEAALAELSALPEDERASPALAYLRGRLLERLGRHAEAARALDLPAAGLPEDVLFDARLRRAQALAASGGCAAARELVLGSRGPALLASRRARAVAASCAVQTGDLEAAIRELRAVLAGGPEGIDEFQLRADLAEALERAGRRPEASRVLHDLLVERPEHRGAPAVEERLRELGDESGFTVAERMARADRLLRKRRVDEALAELDATGRPAKRAQRARWLHLRGMALYKTRQRYADAAEILIEASRLGGATAIDDEFHAARALSRADRDEEAIAAYTAFVAAHPEHERAGEAEYLAAWLELRRGGKQGESLMTRFSKGPRGRKAPELGREAVWQLALAAYRAERWVRAAALFESYARAGSEALVRGRGLYWKARALEQARRHAGAIATYRQAMAVEPLHWYALLARQRVEALGAEPGPPLPAGRPGAELAELPEVALPAEVAFYASLGLDSDAAAALRRRELQVRSAAPEGRELEAVVRACQQLGDHRRAYLIALGSREALGVAPGPATLWIWRAAYPLPHLELVEAAGREHGVEPAHVYATMRQESGYVRDAVSHADAIGLLQVLPETGRAVAERLGLEVSRELLFDPEWNIRIGVAEIGGVRRDFEGNLPLAVAAYNAGPARVRRWLRETGETDLDLFVEQIPFDETRNYVRRVTTHYARYRYLEDPSAGWPEVALPERVGPVEGR